MEAKREYVAPTIMNAGNGPQELAHLQMQNCMITAALGGVLPEQAEPVCFNRVLDVACGPGSWLVDLATMVPTIACLVEVDISTQMIEVVRGGRTPARAEPGDVSCHGRSASV